MVIVAEQQSRRFSGNESSTLNNVFKTGILKYGPFLKLALDIEKIVTDCKCDPNKEFCISN